MTRSVRGPAGSGSPRVLGSLLGILLLLASSASAAEPEVWLERMHEALEALDYEGEFSYFHGHELASLRIAHAVHDGVRRERLVHLNGTPRELIRDGDEVTCLLPPGDHLLDLEQAAHGGPFARAFSRSPRGLPEPYRASFGRSGRIAGREAVQIRVEPEQGDRYGYRLWLDQATGLLLRSELIGLQGEPREIFQFVRVEIGGPVDPALLEPSSESGLVRQRVSLDGAPPEVSHDRVPWEAGWLPSGFAMSGWDLRDTGDGPAMTSLMYSDGLASFSIFLEPADASIVQRQERRGATVVVSRKLRDEQVDKPWRVTVVGEVPMQMAERIAEHVRPREP